ncbi:MAG: hypothetical protein NVS3B20_03570 [Polyangiales bacterium]
MVTLLQTMQRSVQRASIFLASFAVAASVLVALVSTTLLGCSHEAFDGRVYHGGRASFHTGPLSPSWERISLAHGPLLAFRDARNFSTIEVHGRCGLDADDVPISALTKHLLIGFTERETKEERVIRFDGREALNTVVQAKLDGVQMMLNIYVLKKNGCVFDLVYVANPGRYLEGAKAFEDFAMGFGTEEG